MAELDDTKNEVERQFGPGIAETVAEKLGGIANAKMVYGDPVEHEDVIVIPVARVETRFGFGFGGDRGEKPHGGGGGGGVVKAAPAGYIEITKDGTHFRKIGRGAAPAVVAAIGGTIVLSLAVIGAAWGNLGKK